MLVSLLKVEEGLQNQNVGSKDPWGKAVLPLMTNISGIAVVTGVNLAIARSSQNPEEFST